VVTYSSSAPLPLGAAAGLPAARIASPRRAATVMIDAQWRRLADDERASLRRELRHFDVNAEQALFRDTRLPFYQHYRLLEILVPQRRDYRRTYALIATGEDLEPLNGTSPVLHRINAKVGELTVNDTTVDAYLRFFCWAVHGDASRSTSAVLPGAAAGGAAGARSAAHATARPRSSAWTGRR
jgi:hypothetical protein